MKALGTKVYFESNEEMRTWLNSKEEQSKTFEKVIDGIAKKMKENPEDYIRYYVDINSREIDFSLNLSK